MEASSFSGSAAPVIDWLIIDSLLIIDYYWFIKSYVDVAWHI